MKSRLVATAVVATASLAIAVPAVAAGWGATGVGTAVATGASLQQPQAVSTTGQTSASITLKVNAGPAGGATPTAYRVDRTAGPGAANGVCTISSVGGTCDDTGLQSSTSYSYVIRSKIGTNWVSAPSDTITTATTAPADSAPPTITANCPTSSTNYDLGNSGAGSWGNKCGSSLKVDITDASGVASAKFKLQQTTDNTCWNGSTWSSASCTGGSGSDGYFPATAPASGSTWTEALAQPDLTLVDANKAGAKDYTLSVVATDSSSAHNATPSGSPFSVSFKTNN